MEQIFQRIVNICAGRTTSFGLARSCLVGTVVFLSTVVATLLYEGTTASVAFFVLFMYAFALFGTRSMYRSVSVLEHDFENGWLYDPLSTGARLSRFMWLIPFCIFAGASVTQPSRMLLFSVIHLGCSTSATYFMTCVPASPTKRTKRRFVFRSIFSLPQAS